MASSSMCYPGAAAIHLVNVRAGADNRLRQHKIALKCRDAFYTELVFVRVAGREPAGKVKADIQPKQAGGHQPSTPNESKYLMHLQPQTGLLRHYYRDAA